MAVPPGSPPRWSCRPPVQGHERIESGFDDRLHLRCRKRRSASRSRERIPRRSSLAVDSTPGAWGLPALVTSAPAGHLLIRHRGGSILRQYVHEVRPRLKPQRAFVRMEPKPGERFEADWGHFDSLDYQGDQRKLYAFALVDGYSRMQYLEFTHSQSFGTFVRRHVHAFQRRTALPVKSGMTTWPPPSPNMMG